MKHKRCGLFVVTVLLVALLGEAEARVKLITLPVRERVEIRLDRAGATLVEEERVVPLVRGHNQVDFAWANTSIDPGSILFRVVESDSAEVPRVLSVSYPPGEQALVWSVYAPHPGAARVRISYLLNGLDRSFNYRAIASHDEETMTLTQNLRVRNRANEAFPESGIWLAEGKRLTRPVGLAETREVLIERWENVPVRKTYTVDLARSGWLDAAQHKLRVAMHYVLENARSHGLGHAALAPGKVRIYQADSEGGTVFLGEDWGKHTPLGDEMTLYLGVARDIVVKRTIEANQRRRIDGNIFEQHVTLKYEVENFKPESVILDVAEDLERLRHELLGAKPYPLEWTLGPDTDFPQGVDTDKTGAGRIHIRAPLPAAGAPGTAKKVAHRLQIVMKNEW